MESTLPEMLLLKCAAVMATALAGRGCETIHLKFEDVILLQDQFGKPRYEIHFYRKKNNGVLEEKTALIICEVEADVSASLLTPSPLSYMLSSQAIIFLMQPFVSTCIRLPFFSLTDCIQVHRSVRPNYLKW